MNQEFVKKFDGRNVKTILSINSSKKVVAYDSTFKGQEYFTVRQFYTDDDGLLAPGKGLTVPQDKKGELLKALMELMK